VAERAQAQRDFQAQQNQMTRDAVTGRTQMVQGATTRRANTAEAGRDTRSQRYQLEGQARLYDTGKAKAPAEPRSFSNFFGLLGPGQGERNTAEANRLRQQAAQLSGQSDGGGNDVMGIAQQYAQQYSGLSPESLMAIIQQTQPDAADDEQQALLDAIMSLQEPQ
jgi:hypothetical protein